MLNYVSKVLDKISESLMHYKASSKFMSVNMDIVVDFTRPSESWPWSVSHTSCSRIMSHFYFSSMFFSDRIAPGL